MDRQFTNLRVTKGGKPGEAEEKRGKAVWRNDNGFFFLLIFYLLSHRNEIICLLPSHLMLYVLFLIFKVSRTR
jgi:hypothetical protein